MLQIKVNKTRYDVIVAGGGPSGIAAAVSAAECGAKVLLLEATGTLGGMATAGLVTCFAPFTDGEKIISRGFAERVLRKSNLAVGSPEDHTDWPKLDPEALKRIYDDEVTASGAELRLFSTVVGVEREGDLLRSVYVASKAGVEQISADTFIDCTGDGDLAEKAGCAFEYGDATGERQPSTLCFVITGVDEEKLVRDRLFGGSANSVVYDIIKDGKYPEIGENHLCVDFIRDGVIGFNAGHIWDADTTTPESATDGMLRGRRIADAYYRALKEYLPEAFGASHLAVTAPLLGVRESRRIRGKYRLTVEDYFARKSFPDEIGRNCYYLDVHTKIDNSAKSAEDLAERTVYGKGESHGIPFRVMIPVGVDNLLVAGRAVSCDREVLGSLRVMPNCFVMGEAAGVAAAIAKKDGTPVSQVPADKVRAVLKARGAYFL